MNRFLLKDKQVTISHGIMWKLSLTGLHDFVLSSFQLCKTLHFCLQKVPVIFCSVIQQNPNQWLFWKGRCIFSLQLKDSRKLDSSLRFPLADILGGTFIMSFPVTREETQIFNKGHLNVIYKWIYLMGKNIGTWSLETRAKTTIKLYALSFKKELWKPVDNQLSLLEETAS